MNNKNIYIDTSAFMSIVLGQDLNHFFQAQITQSNLYSHELIISESFSVAKRENIPFKDISKSIEKINIVAEITDLISILEELLYYGYCSGADLHHLACAKFLDPTCKNLVFLSGDNRQIEMAKKIGFSTC